MSYYNTTNEKQPELGLLWKRTENQKEIVKRIFNSNLQGFTAFEAWKIYESLGVTCPLTSIRRAVSDLTEEGYLIMTPDKRIGGYGSQNFIYKKK